MDQGTAVSRTGVTGKVALVTGAARGIGEAIARRLADDGAAVACADVDKDAAEKTAVACAALGVPAAGYQVDVAAAAQVGAAVARIEEELGAIDILVNAAGVLRPGRLLELTDEDWSAVFAVNATGVFVVSRAVGARMAERRDGNIVTIASNAAHVPRMAMGAYAASKAASAMVTRCLGLELAGAGIRCNVVCPGSTDTPMLRSLWSSPEDERATLDGSLAAYRVGIPLRRLGRPEDVAGVVAFLVSDDARQITMQEIDVDGGASLR